MHVRTYDFSHVAIAFFYGNISCSRSIPSVYEFSRLFHGFLSFFKLFSVMLAYKIFHRTVLTVTGYGLQMVEAFISFRVFRSLPWRQQMIILHGNKACIFHLILCLTRMSGHTFNPDCSGSGKKVFKIYFTEAASIYGIRKVCSKFFYTEIVLTGTDLFIRCKGKGNPAVLHFRMI